MMEYFIGLILAWLTENVFGVAVTAGGGALLGLIFKKYVKKDDLNTKLDQWLEDCEPTYRKFWRVLARGLTLNISRWPVISLFWNYLIEPLVIFAATLVGKVLTWAVKHAVEAFQLGLLSDNPNYSNEYRSEAAESARDVKNAN